MDNPQNYTSAINNLFFDCLFGPLDPNCPNAQDMRNIEKLLLIAQLASHKNQPPGST